MNSDQLLLIDLSALAHQIYHVSGSEPDPSYVSNQIVARVRALSTEHPHAAICCDCPPYARKDIDPSYKATRPESIAPLLHQMQVAEERLAADGYPVWKSPGAEADDIIATAVRRALEIEGVSILIASSDKDLTQLIGPYVTAKSLTTGIVLDEAGVVAKFGVTPTQMLDYLCLVGDKSDNVIGAKDIGPVTAATLLKTHGSLENIYAAMRRGVVSGITPAKRTSLVEFEPRWPTVRALITLRTDVDIPFEEIAAERTAPAMTEEGSMGVVDLGQAREEMEAEDRELTESEVVAGVKAASGAYNDRELTGAEVTAELRAMMAKKRELLAKSELSAGGSESRKTSVSQAADGNAIPHPPASLVPYAGPVDFSQQLEPRHMDDAVKLADRMFQSRLFSQFGTPQAILAAILAGRAAKLNAIASLRAFHPTDKMPMAADMLRGVVLASGLAAYFRCTERTATRATFATKRGDDPEMTLSYTIEEARKAYQPPAKCKTEAEADAAWAASNYGRNPADMLVARSGAKLARLVYPDVTAGIYVPEELS